MCAFAIDILWVPKDKPPRYITIGVDDVFGKYAGLLFAD